MGVGWGGSLWKSLQKGWWSGQVWHPVRLLEKQVGAPNPGDWRGWEKVCWDSDMPLWLISAIWSDLGCWPGAILLLSSQVDTASPHPQSQPLEPLPGTAWPLGMR